MASRLWKLICSQTFNNGKYKEGKTEKCESIEEDCGIDNVHVNLICFKVLK